MMLKDYIDLESVDEYSSKLEKLGGKVVRNKTAVPGMGYFAFCSDTEIIALPYGKRMKMLSEHKMI